MQHDFLCPRFGHVKRSKQPWTITSICSKRGFRVCPTIRPSTIGTCRRGKRSLADRIENVARTKRDHLGYDILSFEENGRERLIEVKTTRFGSLIPFFATRNEVDVSEKHETEYQLYRLFKFTDQPRLFVLHGALRDRCVLEPNQFSALPK